METPSVPEQPVVNSDSALGDSTSDVASVPAVTPEQPKPELPKVPLGSDSSVKAAKARITFSDGFMRKFVLWFCVFIGVLSFLYAAYVYLSEPYSPPLRVRVTNVSSRSATVSWVTEEPTKGFVIFSEKESFLPWVLARLGKEQAYDDRDVVQARLEKAEKEAEKIAEVEEGAEINYEDIEEDLVISEVGEYYVHHVTLRGLDPEKTYYFRVGNGLRFAASTGEDEKAYSASVDNSLTTFEELDDMYVPDPSYGLVTSEEGTVVDGMIFMRIYGLPSSPVSAVLADNGTWYIDLSNIRTHDGERLTGVDENMNFEELYVEGGSNGTSEVIKNPMTVDAPADPILLDGEAGDGDSESSRLVSRVNAQSSCDCAGNPGGPGCICAWNPSDPNHCDETCGLSTIPCGNGGSCMLDPGPLGSSCTPSGGCPEGKECKIVEGLCPGSSRVRCCNVYGSQEPPPPSGGCGTPRCGPNKAVCWTGGSNGGREPAGGTHSCIWAECTASGAWVNRDSTCCATVGSACDTGGGAGATQDCEGDNIGECMPFSSCTSQGGQVQVGPTCSVSGEVCCVVPGGQDCEADNIGQCITLSMCDRWGGSITSGPTCAGSEETCCTPPGGSYSPCCVNGNDYQFEAECKQAFGALNTGLWKKGSCDTTPPSTSSVTPCGDCAGRENVSSGGYYCLRGILSTRWRKILTVAGEKCPEDPNCGCVCAGDKSYRAPGRSCDVDEVSGKKHIENNTKCCEEAGCTCTWWGRSELVKGEYCPVVPGFLCGQPFYQDICNPEGYTCTSASLGCTGAPISTECGQKEVHYSQMDTGAAVLGSAYAQSGGTIRMSPTAGFYAFGEGGLYCLEYEGDSYCFNITSPGEKRLYIDVNGNGIFDEGDVDIADDVVEIEVSLEASIDRWTIKPGFNVISFEVINENALSMMASQVLALFNEEYNNVFYSIAKLENGRWVTIGNRGGTTYGSDDFQIIPGRGYLLRSSAEVWLEFSGQRVVNPVPLSLTEGWNLIAVHGTDTEYTASSLIDSIDEVNNLDADNVTEWDVSRSKYEGLQKEEDDSGEMQVYGFDFPIDSKLGYFVRIAEGRGKWRPE